ncbi:MAG: LD-carboxypeptidase [Candidatus Aminicenantes bacterium]|nr:LD-carboxypeptidase [Candidatus Aminicenantes bacterium]
MRRRHFFLSFGLSGLSLKTSSHIFSDSIKLLRPDHDSPQSYSIPQPVKPTRLKPGDTVALVAPSGAVATRFEIRLVKECMEALGFHVKLGQHVFDRYGYLGGKDEDRAADLMDQFADPEVAGIVAIRGGWGCARILPYLDFEIIKKNPKVLIGYSDITALLLALYAKTGLVTFHGPIGLDPWNSFTVDYFRRLIMEAQTPVLENPTDKGDYLIPRENRVQTITPGQATGILLGGNLSIISTLLGTDFVPSWEGAILFVEDTNEEIYRIDRLLTQLKLAGVFREIKGFIFGRCTNCNPGEGYGSLTLEQVLDDHIKSLGIPAWYGSMIGHLPLKFTIPLGIKARIDALKGTIEFLEPSVVVKD